VTEEIKFYNEMDFQDSPIGRIPKEWGILKLGILMKLRNGQRPVMAQNGQFPVFGANGIMGYTNGFLADSDFTIVFGRVGASGEVHLGKGKIWVSDNAIFSEEYDRTRAYLPYLFYLLKLKKLSQFASKTTHPIITKTFLDNFSIQLPKRLDEQKDIVRVLGVVDLAIAKTGEVVAKTERLKKGLMQELLTKGIGHKEYKQTPIGKIPKPWQILQVCDILSLEYGKGLPDRDRISGRYPVIGSNGIVGYHNRAFVKGPGIVVGRKGTMGAVSWIDQDFWPIDTTYYVKTKVENISLKWLFYELTHLNPARFRLSDVVPGLKRELVHSMKIGFPPMPEQQRIAECLSVVDKKLALERKEKANLERIKQGLMDLVLTGKVRIKVD